LATLIATPFAKLQTGVNRTTDLQPKVHNHSSSSWAGDRI